MSLPKFKLVIFDWSGVIADTFDNWYFCAMHVFKTCGAAVITKEEARREFRQPYMAFYNKYLPNLSFEDQQRAYAEAMQDCAIPPIFKGMRDLLSALRDRDVHMAVISGDTKKSLFKEAGHYQVTHYFKDILSNVYEKTQAVQQMISDHRLHPTDTLFIGDSMHEIEVGKVVGCKTCAVTWGYVSKDKLKEMHPDFIVDTPQSLQDVIL